MFLVGKEVPRGVLRREPQVDVQSGQQEPLGSQVIPKSFSNS